MVVHEIFEQEILVYSFPFSSLAHKKEYVVTTIQEKYSNRIRNKVYL